MSFVCFHRMYSSCRARSAIHVSEEASELLQYMHGRKFNERRDSVTEDILRERANHQARIATAEVSDISLFRILEKSGLGSKRRRKLVYTPVPGAYGLSKTATGAGGSAVHLASASSNWPIFKHMLPEIAFAGHSNSGKSTLVNALSGVAPKAGVASVSDRAGWTDQICFYQLGKKPPKLTLADLPGYGHAVASVHDRRAWKEMTRDYLKRRPVLSRCCVLVDCTRGLCAADESIIRFLHKSRVQWQVILTKGDLLDVNQLAKCITVVESDLRALIRDVEGKGPSRESSRDGDGECTGVTVTPTDSSSEETDTDLQVEPSSSAGPASASVREGGDESGSVLEGKTERRGIEQKELAGQLPRPKRSYAELPNRLVMPVSASTGAGIGMVWEDICLCAERSYAPLPPGMAEHAEPSSMIREHRLAHLVHRRLNQ